MPTAGSALMQAKQRYYNSAAAGTLSNYDEKILGVMTLYGLPMLGVSMPVTQATYSAQHNDMQSASPAAGAVFTTSTALTFTYTAHTQGDWGTYYTVNGGNDVSVSAGRPVAPRATVPVYEPGSLARGVLMVGGAFVDTADFDPVISRIVTDSVFLEDEPAFLVSGWYPVNPGAINRLLTIDGVVHEQLVVIPTQFMATTLTTPTTGMLRRYTDLQFEVYHAPFDAADFIAPSIWGVTAISSTEGLDFVVWLDDTAEDDDPTASIARVVMLYQLDDETTWRKAELTYEPNPNGVGRAVGRVAPLTTGRISYFAQAVDRTGNVALALQHGAPFTAVEIVTPVEPAGATIYLPLVLRGYE